MAKATEKGWVIYAKSHPANNREMLVSDSFRWSKQRAIDDFIKGTSLTWPQWKRKYGYACVRATMTVTVISKHK